MGLGAKKTLPEDLIESLHEVASAVSAKRSLDEVLDTVVERAKSITRTDKAVLCLVQQDDYRTMDTTHLAVRGCRDVHSQSWWLEALGQAGPEALNGGGRVRVKDRDNDAVLLVVPVRLAEQPIGLLGAINSLDHGFTPADEAFLAILGSFAAVAIDNTRLAEESRYVLLASERSRIAREMHDGLSQSLFSISLGLELCKRQLWHDPHGVGELLGGLQEQLKSSMNELRRYIYDLRPLKLSELGLVGAVQEWVREVTLGRGIRAEVRVSGTPVLLGADAELCLYRIAKEAVSNTVKHAAAKYMVVSIDYGENLATLSVQDDGSGFDVDGVLTTAGVEGGMGLRDMRAWADRAGEHIMIESAPGRGTLVRIRVQGRGAGQ